MAVPRRFGRPPLDADDPSVTVNVRLPSKVYDKVYQAAQRERCGVPEVIRRAVKDKVEKQKT